MGTTAGDDKGVLQPAFSSLYVYQKAEANGQNWVQVGPDSYGKTIGWLPQSCTVDWKMQLTLAFTNPSGRHPMLFFRDKSDVEAILNSKKPSAMLDPLLTRLKHNQPVPQVLAREPDYMVDQLKNFYLLPVLGSDDIFTDTGFQVRVLNVALKK